MQVSQRVGFLREGRYPRGLTRRLPKPAKGAPQIPQRGLDGSDLSRPIQRRLERLDISR
jgi:hypothetical protein